MLGNNSSYVVLGEASESDEEEFTDKKLPTKSVHFSNSVVVCEQLESENEFQEDYNITAGAFKARAEEAQYNSLLHKKLRESNFKLKEDLKQLVTSSLKFTSDQVGEINQRLLRNQVEIQDTIKYLRRSTTCVTKVENIMPFLLTQNFIPTINIDI